MGRESRSRLRSFFADFGIERKDRISYNTVCLRVRCAFAGACSRRLSRLNLSTSGSIGLFEALRVATGPMLIPRTRCTIAFARKAAIHGRNAARLFQISVRKRAAVPSSSLSLTPFPSLSLSFFAYSHARVYLYFSFLGRAAVRGCRGRAARRTGPFVCTQKP